MTIIIKIFGNLSITFDEFLRLYFCFFVFFSKVMSIFFWELPPTLYLQELRSTCWWSSLFASWLGLISSNPLALHKRWLYLEFVWPIFSYIGVNTEIYWVNLRIQSKRGKRWAIKIMVHLLDNFYALFLKSIIYIKIKIFPANFSSIF